MEAFYYPSLTDPVPLPAEPDEPEQEDEQEDETEDCEPAKRSWLKAINAFAREVFEEEE